MDAVRDGDVMGRRGLFDFLEMADSEMVWRSEGEEEEEKEEREKTSVGVGAGLEASWMWRISGFNGGR